MLTALWSHKAGSGVSTTAAAMAVECAKFGEDVLLVDFGGDLPSILGVDAPAVGVAQLVAPLADGRADSVDAVARVAESVGGGLWLIGRGLDTSLNERHIDVSDVARFMARLRADHRRVIVDMGDVAVSAVGEAFLQMADRSILISRLCGLSLHRAPRAGPNLARSGRGRCGRGATGWAHRCRRGGGPGRRPIRSHENPPAVSSVNSAPGRGRRMNGAMLARGLGAPDVVALARDVRGYLNSTAPEGRWDEQRVYAALIEVAPLLSAADALTWWVLVRCIRCCRWRAFRTF